MFNSFLKQFFFQPLRRLFWLGWWLVGLGTMAWYSLHLVTGDRFWPVRLVGYFMPWLLLGLAPGLVLAGLARRLALTALLAMPTFLIGLTFAPLFLPRPSTALADSTPLQVMSYNVLRSNYNYEAILRLIDQEQPDILLLQEVSPAVARHLQAGLAELYPGETLAFVYERDMGQVIVSRYPLESIEVTPAQARAQKVRVATPQGSIQVWNIHAPQPIPWSRQYRQLARMVTSIAEVDEPLIVGGDFNTTDQSEIYRLINLHLENAHWQAGWGFGFTFPAHNPKVKRVPVPVPLVRIDHIFYSRHFYPRSARTLAESGGSDHLPVVAKLSLVEE